MAEGRVCVVRRRPGDIPAGKCRGIIALVALAAALAAPETAGASTRLLPPFGFSSPFVPDVFDDRMRPPPPVRATPRPAAKSRTRAVSRKPAGPLLIAVSLQRQSIKIYDANGLFAEAPVSTGMRGHATPAGVFSIIQKNKWHRSNIYSGAPMPYMQRLTWSGIALHAGALPGYPASHGCIRMPTAFAAQLWNWTRRGARVVVSHGEVAPVAVSHPLLDALPHAVPIAAVPDTPDPDKLGLRPTLGSAPSSTVNLRTADAGTAAQPDGAPVASDAPAPVVALPAPVPSPPPSATASAPRRGPISVFISRADGRLYARQDFAPLFDAPVAIADAGRPLGTHVLTARRDPADKDRFVWSAVTLPDRAAQSSGKTRRDRHASPAEAAPVPEISAALDRIALPPDIMARIAEGLASGSALIVADQSLKSGETGQGTEFVLLTR